MDLATNIRILESDLWKKVQKRALLE